MRIGLDTSVVLRLLIGEPADQALQAIEFFHELQNRGADVLISDLAITETYYALQHHYHVPKKEALDQLHRLLSTDSIVNLGVSLKVLRTPQLESAKPGFVDRVIHAQYLPEVDVVVSFERASRRLAKTRVLGAQT